MAKRLLTEEEVKRFLNISDFRNLSKEKLITFISSIPIMDKDVAIKIIEQFPEFNNYVQVIISYYNSMYDSILKQNDHIVHVVMDGYKSILETLCTLSTMEKISSKDRRLFAKLMVEVADKMAAYEVDNKKFLFDMSAYNYRIIMKTLIIGSVILGVHFFSPRIPRIV